MTIRRFLIWYVGSLAFVAATGASSYRALDRLHGPLDATPAATAVAAPVDPLPHFAAADPVAAPASAPPLPALRQHVASIAVPKPVPSSAHAVHRVVAIAPTTAHEPARQVAVSHRVPMPGNAPVVAAYQPPAQTYAYYPYYAYRSGYAYYAPYSRYPYYSVR